MDTKSRASRTGWWGAVRRSARAIRDFNDEQVWMWERILLSSRTLVPPDGPLTWIRTLDGYRLAGSGLPAAVSEEGCDSRG
jgi:hypothetical protein